MRGKHFRKLLLAFVAAIAMAFAGVAATGTATAATDAGASTSAGATISKLTSKQKKAKKRALAKCRKVLKKSNKRARKFAPKRAKRVRKANKRRAKACVKRIKKKYKKISKRQWWQNLPGEPAPKITAPATFKARGSVGEAYVTGATEGDTLLLVNRHDRTIRKGVADRFGSKIFYDINPAAGFTVRLKKDGKVQGTKKFSILKPGDNPAQSFYKNQTLKQGLNYVTMRDGVELAMTVRLPQGKTLADGPFPTVIEHSGYGTAAPHDLLAAVLGGGDPLAPDTSTAVGGLILPQMGFAAVSVQMRGSGCSGGAFDLFGLPTTYDGYDMIETVGNQSWVKGKVGMAGISFSGISQLFAAGTQPPHLAAIAPMSVTDDMYTATGYPGGIFNKGFALSWIRDRMRNAEPAPEGGQGWAKEMILNGDPKADDTSPDLRCLKNQELRLQTRDANVLIEENPFRTPLFFAERSPGKWMKDINVPVFLTGAFQDEQTGGHFPQSLAQLKDNKNVWMVLQNGVHVDSLGPSVITTWGDFMNLFVAKQIPKMPSLLVSMSGMLYGELADAPALPVQDSKYKDYTSVSQAEADFRKDNPRLRLLMDNGAAIPGSPGGIGAAWDIKLGDWPVPSTKATEYFFNQSGAMTANKPATQSSVEYTSDPAARPIQTLVGAGEADAWKAQPPYNWAPVTAGKGLGFTSPAMTGDTLIAGPSSLDLWLKSSALDTDIQVTLSEVRPDGKETYVQNGWLRASHRKLDKKLSTALNPVPTHLKEDGANLPQGEYSEVRVPIFPVAHMFRAGSKIRVTITAPGGDRPIWDFATLEQGTTSNSILLGGAKPSKLVLPVIPGVDAQGKPLPTPTALRGQPSRDYATASNGG